MKPKTLSVSAMETEFRDYSCHFRGAFENLRLSTDLPFTKIKSNLPKFVSRLLIEWSSRTKIDTLQRKIIEFRSSIMCL